MEGRLERGEIKGKYEARTFGERLLRRLNGIVAESDRGSLSLFLEHPIHPSFPHPPPNYVLDSLDTLFPFTYSILRNRAILVKVFGPPSFNPLKFVLSNSIRLIRKDFGPQFGIILSSPTVHACPRFSARITDLWNYPFFSFFLRSAWLESLTFNSQGTISCKKRYHRFHPRW